MEHFLKTEGLHQLQKPHVGLQKAQFKLFCFLIWAHLAQKVHPKYEPSKQSDFIRFKLTLTILKQFWS